MNSHDPDGHSRRIAASQLRGNPSRVDLSLLLALHPRLLRQDCVYTPTNGLNLHCGALSVVVESPSHSFSTMNRNKEIAFLTPDMLLDSQLLCHLEAMRFLVESGGRSKWTPSPIP